MDAVYLSEIWNLRSTKAFPVGARCLQVENAHVFVEFTMNIFYVIGVVVVIVVVAGFLGVHL